MAQVMIVGAGPTGLMLACDLRRAGVSVQLVDRAHRRLVASRGAAVHPRTMELFDQRGIVDEFLAAAVPFRWPISPVYTSTGRRSPLGFPTSSVFFRASPRTSSSAVPIDWTWACSGPPR
ncbi:MAG: pentachlorophenol monooxygenase [Mycobacterium sp.]|nr:pentachlorophenol monooxygenase [Mycobacterium sp.]